VVLAAIGVAATAGVTLLAVDVGLDGAAIARLDVGHVFADFENLDPEFVTGDAGVGKEGHFAEVAPEIGAADSDAIDADEDIIWPRGAGIVDVDDVEVFGFGELDGFHGKFKSGVMITGVGVAD
jgi:hypothetical protein